MLDKRATDIILGDLGCGDSFTIKYLGMKFRLRIRELTTKRLIKISYHLSQLKDLQDGDESKFQALMEHISDAKHICRAISVATGTRFEKIVANAILDLPPKDILTLFNLVRKYSDAEAFFFTIILAKKTSLMKTKKAG